MHISKVRGNVKAGADVAIGPKTLVVGPNGVGKSTIVNVIELALTSRVGDIAGRVDIAREADVMALAPKGVKKLLAEVEFDTGAIASYAVEGSTAKAKKAVVARGAEIAHEDVLPIRTLREALLGSPQTARKFLLGKVGGDVTRADVLEMLPEPVRPAWATCTDAIDSSMPLADVLVTVIETASKQQRDANAAAKTAREAAKLVGGGRASPPSKGDVAAKKVAREQAREKLEQVRLSQSAHERFTAAQAELEALTSEAEKACAALSVAETALASTTEPVPPHPVLPHVREVINESIPAGECLACGMGKPCVADLDAIDTALGTYKADSAAYATLKKNAQAARVLAEKLVARVEAKEREVQQLATDVQSAEANAATFGESLEAAKTAYDEADQALTDLKIVADAWASAQKAEGAALEHERQAEEWKNLKDACEKAMAMTLDMALAAFIAKVQANLPAGDLFDLRMRDGEREVVQFGLVRDGMLHTALSGAEWARVMAAMAAACVPAGRYACLIPEERAFDPATLTGVLTALGQSPHQVVITSPVAPKSIPEGWTLVERQ